MSQIATSTDDVTQLHDKRHTRGRFSWVKRLVQGQNKSMATGIRTPPYEPNSELNICPHTRTHSDNNSTRKSIKSADFASDEESISMQSDNISTTPLKLITSHTSTTNPPSVLSGDHNHHYPDNISYVASTAETSLSPSTFVSLSPSFRAQARVDRDREGTLSGSNSHRDRERERERERERDSESIITLASSTRRVCRRSIDTNCSMAGIPPASIMERLLVHPTAANLDAQESE